MVWYDKPVSIAVGLSFNHSAMVKPNEKEIPKMNRFRDEFRSTYCRFEMPTATIRPRLEF